MNIPTVGHPEVSSLSYSRADVSAVRLGGTAAVVASALMVTHQVVDAMIGGTTDAPRALLHTAWLVALFLAIRGVGVLQRPVSDRIGRILILVALTGVGATTVGAAVEALLLLTSPGTASEDPPMPILVVLISILVLLVVGLLGFAVGILRAGVLPRSVGLLLLVGVLDKMVAPDWVPSLAILGLTVAWLGVAMMRRGGTGATR